VGMTRGHAVEEDVPMQQCTSSIFEGRRDDHLIVSKKMVGASWRYFPEQSKHYEDRVK
jgi:hypothetical protein